jgi:crotonobetainyl-CoA:carnitine CoA-transferase CaiB-like acyl-CoA transferase
MLNEWFNRDFLPKFTTEEFFEEASRRGVTAVPVYRLDQIVDNPHLAARHFFQEVEHPTIGSLRVPKLPYYSAEFPWRPRRPAPLLGEHNDDVYRGDLGLSAAELEALQASGTV